MLGIENIVIGAYPRHNSISQNPAIRLHLPACPDLANLSIQAIEFITCYCQALLADEEKSVYSETAHSTIEAIRFTLNELIENALKYRQGGAIEISIAHDNSQLLIMVCNSIAPQMVKTLAEKFNVILSVSPEKLLIYQVESNAALKLNQSGLGLILLRHDYQIKLGWLFNSLTSTMAKLETVAILPFRQGDQYGN